VKTNTEMQKELMISKFNKFNGILLQPLVICNVLDIFMNPSLELVRCKSCRTLASPYMVLLEDEHQFICNNCRCRNRLCTTGFTSMSSNEISTLNQGCTNRILTSQWTSTKAFTIQSNNVEMTNRDGAVYIFVIDISKEAIKNGSLKTSIENIKGSLESFDNYNNAKVGFITFDQRIYGHSFRLDSAKPWTISISHIDDFKFASQISGFLIELQCFCTYIEAFLETLIIVSLGNIESHSSLTTALRAAKILRQFLKSAHGKILIFQITSLLIKKRRFSKIKSKLLSELNLTNFGNYITLEFFVHIRSCHLDLVLLASLSWHMNGILYLYCEMEQSQNRLKLVLELHRNLTREQFRYSLWRVRGTKGFKFEELSCYFIEQRPSTLVHESMATQLLPFLNEDKVYSIKIDPDYVTENSSFIDKPEYLQHTMFTPSDTRSIAIQINNEKSQMC